MLAPRRGPAAVESPGPPARETSLTGSAELPRGRSLALVLALEPLHAPGGVHELLLAGVEGVTLRAHLHPDVRLGRTGANDLSARTRDGGVDVVGMNASLHGPPPRSFENTSRNRKRQKRRYDRRGEGPMRTGYRVVAAMLLVVVGVGWARGDGLLPVQATPDQ